MQILEENNVEYAIIEYLKNPPTIVELKKVGKFLNLEPSYFIRKCESIYKDLNLNNYINNPNKLYEIISKNPILLERPIIVKGDKAVIGRPPENILSLL